MISIVQFVKYFSTIFLRSFEGPSWSWWNGSWISNYLCSQCLLPLMLWVRTPLRRGVLDKHYVKKFVSDQVATGRWFPPGTPVSSTNKADRHDITDIWLKVALNSINHKPNYNPSLSFHVLKWNTYTLFLILPFYMQEASKKGKEI